MADVNAQEEVDKHVQEGKDQIIDMADDWLPEPLNQAVRLLMKCIPIDQWIARVGNYLSAKPGSALFHLMFFECLPVYFFVWSVRSYLRSFIVAINYRGMETDTGTGWKDLIGRVDDVIKEADGRPGIKEFSVYLEECFQTKASKALALFDPMWINEERCVEDYAKTRQMPTSFEIDQGDSEHPGLEFVQLEFRGTLLLSSIFVLYMLISFLCKAGFRSRCSSGAYFQFVLNRGKHIVYRYIAALFHLGALVVLVACVYFCSENNLLGWFVETQVTAMLIVIISMRYFTVPVKPKFTYDGELGNWEFKRPFLGTTRSFVTTLNSALVAYTGGNKVPLKNLQPGADAAMAEKAFEILVPSGKIANGSKFEIMVPSKEAVEKVAEVAQEAGMTPP